MTEITGKLDLHAPPAAPDEEKPAEDTTRVPTLTGTFRRVRRGHSVRMKDVPLAPADPAPDAAPASMPPPSPRPARVAIMLALAHKLQRMLDVGQVGSMADIADMLGVTRARVTQIMDLALLAPDIQAAVIEIRLDPCREAGVARALRRVVAAQTWREQRAAWRPVGAPDGLLSSVARPRSTRPSGPRCVVEGMDPPC